MLLVGRMNNMKWIKISDQLPELNERFLITNGKIVYFATFAYKSDKLYDTEISILEEDCYFKLIEFTHWMPLPLPHEE